jgi:hypothetical protein
VWCDNHFKVIDVVANAVARNAITQTFVTEQLRHRKYPNQRP